MSIQFSRDIRTLVLTKYEGYRKTKSEMQDWLVAQKIVQEILKEDEQEKEQLHEQEEENRQSSR